MSAVDGSFHLKNVNIVSNSTANSLGKNSKADKAFKQLGNLNASSNDRMDALATIMNTNGNDPVTLQAVQMITEEMGRVTSFFSNMMKSMHETLMAVIRNLR